MYSERDGSVAYINIPTDMEVLNPVIVVNAITSDGGILESLSEKGVAVHPHVFSNAGVIQKCLSSRHMTILMKKIMKFLTKR